MEIELLSLTVQPIRGFEYGDHHFSAAESALPAVDEPPTDVPSSPRYHYFCLAMHLASLIAATSGRQLHSLALQHVHGSNTVPRGNTFTIIAFL